jgi:hypothetical protein
MVFKEKRNIAELLTKLERPEISKRFWIIKESYSKFHSIFLDDLDLNNILSKRKSTNKPARLAAISIKPASPFREKAEKDGFGKQTLGLDDKTNLNRKPIKMVSHPLPRLKSSIIAALLIATIANLLGFIDDIILRFRFKALSQQLDTTVVLGMSASSFPMLSGMLYAYALKTQFPTAGAFEIDDLVIMNSMKKIIESVTDLSADPILGAKLKNKESICNDINSGLVIGNTSMKLQENLCSFATNGIVNYTFIHGVQDFMNYYIQSKALIEQNTTNITRLIMSSEETGRKDVLGAFLSIKLLQYRDDYYAFITRTYQHLQVTSILLNTLHCFSLLSLILVFHLFWVNKRMRAIRELVKSFLMLHDNILNNSYVKSVFC